MRRLRFAIRSLWATPLLSLVVILSLGLGIGVNTAIFSLLHNDEIDIEFDVVEGEDRWTSIGHTGQLRILVVVWTMRERAIRPVTAFAADRGLAQDYLEMKGL
jgi:uncharacterized DUF497 family protein